MKSNKHYVAFRVDASSQIGTGHFMRCVSLALQLHNIEANVVFVCRYITSTLSQILSDNGFELRLIDEKNDGRSTDELTHAKWLGVSQAQDAESSIKALSDRKRNWLIVDHYSLDHLWEKRLRNSTDSIMVIDDIADRIHDCDLLLDQNLYLDMNIRYEGKVPNHCRLLLGPRYALLRPQFLDVRHQMELRNHKVERVLVFFGGVDSEDYTSKAIAALAKVSDRSFEVDVVIGNQHPNKNKIIDECIRQGYFCHLQTERMASLIADADIAIGAGGSATWERCALGLPTITIPVAQNQQKLVNDAAHIGLIYAPELNLNLIDCIHLHFIALLGNPILRKNLSESSMKFVDARGIGRVARIMLPSKIVLKEADENDMKSIHEWRNHTSIRAVSRSSSTIEWDEHQKWFETLLNNDDAKLLIGKLNNKDIGVVRFDFSGSKAEISIFLIPQSENSGMGSDLLKAAENWLYAMHPEICQLDAEVMETNSRSKHFFTSNGYTRASSIYFKRMKS